MSLVVNHAEEDWKSSMGARTLEKRCVYFLLPYVLVIFLFCFLLCPVS